MGAVQGRLSRGGEGQEGRWAGQSSPEAGAHQHPDWGQRQGGGGALKEPQLPPCLSHRPGPPALALLGPGFVDSHRKGGPF